MAERGAERDLDGALTALVAAALRRAAETGDLPPPDQARLVAQALAVGLRELVRAPLREAQAGYDLGWRAAQDAQRQSVSAPPTPAVDLRPAPALSPAGAPSPASPHPAGRAPAAPAPLPEPHPIFVEVAPLASFSAVNRFHAAVAGLPEVVDTTMVAFRDGCLTLQVDHPDGAALAASLQALDVGPIRVVAVRPDRVQLALDSPPSSGRVLRQARDA